MGYPSREGWDTPPIGKDGGTLHLSEPDGVPPVGGWWYPPPMWTDTQIENITFPILRMRAVIIEKLSCLCCMEFDDHHRGLDRNAEFSPNMKKSIKMIRGIRGKSNDFQIVF